MKFLHTGDIHIGSCRRLTPESDQYLQRHMQHLYKILKVAAKEKVDFALVAGDIFEDSQTTIPEMVEAALWFHALGEVCPVVVTAGNHDELSVGKFQTEWLSQLNIPNVTFCSKPQSVELKGLTRVLAVPWTGIKNQKEFEEYVQSNWSGEPICMLHECMLGSLTDSGYRAKTGIKVPDIEGVRYFACADIHRYQRLNLDHAWYPGSPLQTKFDDGPDKGVIVVDVLDQYRYEHRFVRVPCAIELHTISSINQIPADSPHWYKLVCEVSKMPLVKPDCVKKVEPIACRIEISEVLSKDDQSVEAFNRSIDFTLGVPELLGEHKFTAEEIAEEIHEIRRVVA